MSVKKQINELEMLLHMVLTKDKVDNNLYIGRCTLFGNIFDVEVYLRRSDTNNIGEILFQSMPDCNEFGVEYISSVTDNYVSSKVSNTVEVAMKGIIRLRSILMGLDGEFLDYINDNDGTLIASGTISSLGDNLEFIGLTLDDLPVDILGSHHEPNIGKVFNIYNKDNEEVVGPNYNGLENALREVMLAF